MTKQAFAYLRVSGKNQIGGHGFSRQLDAIERHCNKNGYKIEQVFREQVSGVKGETERPEFLSMISEVIANGVDVVIIEGLDRLSRELRIQEQLLIYLASKNVTLIAANTEENVTEAIKEDPVRKAMIQVQGAFSELEKNRLVLRLKKGRERKRQTEGWREGPPPYGSLPGEKEVLKRISYMRRKSRKTFQIIADRFNEEGILTRTGKTWSASLAANIFKNSRERR